MKKFEDFVNLVNDSEQIQSRLIKSTKLDLEPKMYNLADESDLSEIIGKIQESIMRGSMELLRAYHEWSNQSEK